MRIIRRAQALSGNKEELVSRLEKDLREYVYEVASVQCPTECPNFLSPGPDGSAFGCSLDVCTPMDCAEANLLDMARWLVGKGWVNFIGPQDGQ